MSNIITIKHGSGIPQSKLKHYEFGYSDDKKNLYLNTPTALIALNLGKFDISNCEEIIAGKDLNNYIDAGTYICKDIGSLINKPNTTATKAKLFVIKIANNEEIFQILIDNNSGLWIRVYNKEWKEWINCIERTVVDSELNLTSINPVQNKIITAALNNKLSLDGGDISGTLKLLNKNEALSNSYNNPPIIIGGNSNETHLEIDKSKIISKNNEKTTSILDINPDGGLVRFGKDGIVFADTCKEVIKIPVDGIVLGYNQSLNKFLESFCPMSSGGNVTIGYGNYENNSGNTNIYGSDINLSIKEAGEDVKFRPYYRKGDIIPIDIDTSGYISGGGTNVIFTIPIDRPILGSPTITASTVKGFKVRQNSKYLYGSSANTYAKPSSYKLVSYKYGPFITIFAVFSNTTNVENNSATGLNWSGKITLT